MLTFYMHKKTVRTYDYGDLLGIEEGLAWSSTGKPEDAVGFEPGNFEALVLRKRCFPGVELRIGEPIERSFDMNPRGDI